MRVVLADANFKLILKSWNLQLQACFNSKDFKGSMFKGFLLISKEFSKEGLMFKRASFVIQRISKLEKGSFRKILKYKSKTTYNSCRS